MRAAALFLPLALLGCASHAADPPPYRPPPPVPATPPPPLMTWMRIDGQPGMADQGNVDLATCQAVAVNAANQVQIPPSGQGFDVAPEIALMRQRQTQDANFRACMGQHGYRIAPVPQK